MEILHHPSLNFPIEPTESNHGVQAQIMLSTSLELTSAHSPQQITFVVKTL